MGRPLSILLAAVACVWLGCSESPRPPDSVPESAEAPRSTSPQSAVVRGIEIEAGTLGTTGLARVEIGPEMRTVALSQPRFLPRWRERTELIGETIEIDVVRPTEVALDAPVQADVMISVGDVVQQFEEALEDATKKVVDTGREWIRAQGSLAPGETGVTVQVAIPEALRGRSGLLDVILRPLTSGAAQTWSMAPARIVPGQVLRFGYGVEEPAWKPGWPAAAFRVEAIVAGEPETRVLFERHIDPVHDPRDRRWHDAWVPLDEFVGLDVTLRFTQHAIPTGDITHSLMALANPMIVPARRPGPRPPARDVVLISLDTLRSPSVSSYGYGRPTTPRMDALLAERGARFSHAFAPRPYTPPSHMTMLTGLFPCAHGVDNRHMAVGSDRPLLAERLRAAGYATAAFTENANVAVSSGFNRGFDDYYEVRSEESATPGFATETFGHAADWVRRVDDRPFFLFVHTYQVHDPYLPPSGYAGMFGEDFEGDVVPAKHRGKRNDYDREIRFTDEVVADFLGVLDQQGLGDALVIVTSDHGEQFGEHFWTNHGFSTHDEAILVPFFVRAPGKVPAGRVVDVHVTLADIVPTVLDLLGMPAADDVQGRSLAPLVVGEAPALEAELHERHLFAAASHSKSIITDEFKVSFPRWDNDKPWVHVIDRQADPGERNNLAKALPEKIDEGRAWISDFETSCAAFVDAHPTRPGDTYTDGNQPAWMINRDVIEEKLRSLGYIE